MTEAKKRVPALRFPGFEGEWEEKKFGEIYSFRSTNSLSRECLNYDDGEVRNIHYGDIHTKFRTAFKIDDELVPYINSGINLSKITKTNYCQEKDLVIADASEDYSDIGKAIEIVKLGKEPVLAGLHTILARPDLTPMSAGFGGYGMRTVGTKKQIYKIAQGIKVLSLSAKQLAGMSVFWPTLPEQEKIADFLSGVDERIGLLKRKKERLETYKRGVMQQIFSQRLRFRDQNGNDYPEWKERSFEDVVISFPTKKFQILTTEIQNIGQYVVVDQGKKQIAGYSNNADRLFTDYPVIIFGDHTTVIKFVDHSFVIGADGTKILKCINSENIKYVFFYLQYRNIGQEGYKRHFSILKQINIELPCLEEQQKIADFLTAIDEKIELCEKQIAGTEKFKKGLLQQMFI